MSTIACCNDRFEKYKDLLDNLNKVIETFHKWINTVENCLDFKEYKDFINLAKQAEVGKFMYLVEVNFFIIDW